MQPVYLVHPSCFAHLTAPKRDKVHKPGLGKQYNICDPSSFAYRCPVTHFSVSESKQRPDDGLFDYLISKQRSAHEHNS